MESVEVLEQLEDGDRVLYNQKRTPLTVVDVREDAVLVQGPKGGEYLLFVPEDNPELVLESQSGNRDYASKVEELRVVGEWVQQGEDTWQHTRSAVVVELVQNDAGYWTVTVSGFDGDPPDIPKYGFVNREYALDAATTFMDTHPEG